VNDLVDMPPPLLITNISFFEGCGRGQEFPRTVTPPGAVRPFAPVVCSCALAEVAVEFIEDAPPFRARGAPLPRPCSDYRHDADNLRLRRHRPAALNSGRIAITSSY